MRADLFGLDFQTFSAWLRDEVGYSERHHAAAYRALFQSRCWQPDAVPLWHEAARTCPVLLVRLQALVPMDGTLLPAVVTRQTGENVEGEVTRKLLLRFADGAEVETVLIPMAHGARHTVCVSSQVGCRMGCGFCRTARMGLRRQLTAHEIVAQVLVAAAELGSVPRNVVFMGMGEPFDNIEAVAQAVRVLSERQGLAIAHRHITISTVGRVDVFPQLQALGLLRTRLAISLTVADDVLRSQLMPVNRTHDLTALKQAVQALPLGRNQRVMISCAVIAGINDAPAQREQLVEWLHGLPVMVNLIPFNPIPGMAWRRPDDAVMEAYKAHLMQAGIQVRMRLTKGDGVLAACGQLGVIGPQRRSGATPA